MKKLNMIGVAWDAWRTTRAGKDAIQQRREERLQAIVDYARQHSPFYAELYRELPHTLTDVTQLPPVNKRQLMAHFEDWVTDPTITREAVDAFLTDMSNVGSPFMDDYMLWTTSGTTGDPAILLQDKNWVAVAGGMSLARVIPVWISWGGLWRILRGGRRMVAVFSTAGHYLGVSMVERQRKSSPLRAKAIRVMSAMTPLPQLVSDLNEFQPVMLSGYASVLTLLAKEQLAGRLHISPVMVSSSGETLNETMREKIESAWHTTAWNGYSSSETGVMAQQCSHGNLHLNADWYIVEAVDEQGQPVPPGTPSYKIYVTNLVSTIQPIIRYEMGDSIRFDPQPCTCGSPLPVIHVEGRTDEILELREQDGSTIHILPLAIASITEETPGLHRYQIVQSDSSTLKIRMETAPNASRDSVWEELQRRLTGWLIQQGASNTTLVLANEPPQLQPNSGKLRHVLVAMDSELSRENEVRF